MKRFDEYENINPEAELYFENASAMTGENLHSKAHIVRFVTIGGRWLNAQK